MVRTPGDVGMNFERVELKTEGEPTLVGWFLPTRGKARGTILFLHGNAENISTHLAAIYWLPDSGYQVFIFDYQGYGESGGSAAIENLYPDTVRAARYLEQRADVRTDRLFIMGQSLGAALALYTAAQPQFAITFRAVVADSPFSGYRDIAREKLASVWLSYPLQWPLGFLIDDELSPKKYVTQIHAPVLFLHGTNDAVVPAHHSAELCAQLQSRCQRWEIQGASHGEGLALPEYRKRLVQYLDNPPDYDAQGLRSAPG